MKRISDQVMLILVQLWNAEAWYVDELKKGIGFLPDDVRYKWHKEIMRIIHGQVRSKR